MKKGFLHQLEPSLSFSSIGPDFSIMKASDDRHLDSGFKELSGLEFKGMSMSLHSGKLLFSSSEAFVWWMSLDSTRSITSLPSLNQKILTGFSRELVSVNHIWDHSAKFRLPIAPGFSNMFCSITEELVAPSDGQMVASTVLLQSVKQKKESQATGWA
jgi:hypothetical protein